MHANPLISVILPVSNFKEKLLTQAVDSIISQTFTEFELLFICEHNSNSDSIAILKEFCRRDKRLRLIINESNIGLSASLNRGIRDAKGKYIARMDADDISAPKRFELQFEFLEKHPDISVLGTKAAFIDAEGKPIIAWDRYPVEHEQIKADLLFWCCLWHPSVMFRRSALLDNDLIYDTSIKATEDYDLWNRAVHRLRFANLEEKLIGYRFHKSNISINNKDIGLSVHLDIMKRSFENMGLDFTDEELRLLCHITRNIVIGNRKRSLTALNNSLRRIEEANHKLNLYSQAALKDTIKRHFGWRKRWVLLNIIVMLRSVSDMVKNESLRKLANFLEVHGIFMTMRKILLLCKNKLFFNL
jgi:glycosyltransferase involved in cell wall biosynthesis